MSGKRRCAQPSSPSVSPARKRRNVQSRALVDSSTCGQPDDLLELYFRHWGPHWLGTECTQISAETGAPIKQLRRWHTRRVHVWITTEDSSEEVFESEYARLKSQCLSSKGRFLIRDFNSCIREGGHDRPCILAPVPRKTPRPLDTWTLSSSSSEDEDESDDSGGELVVVTPVKRGVQKGARTPQQPGCSRQSTAERGKRETKKHYTVAKKLVCFGGFTLREEIDSPEERESGSKRRFFRRVESSDGATYSVGDWVLMTSNVSDKPLVGCIKDLFSRSKGRSIQAMFQCQSCYCREEAVAADGGFYETCNPHEVLLAADTTELEVSVILGPCEVFCVACDWDDSSFANIVRLQDDQSSRYFARYSYNDRSRNRFLLKYLSKEQLGALGLKSLRTPSISSSSGSGGEKGVPDEEAFPRCPPAPLFSGIEDLPEAVLHSIQDHKKENIAIETPSSSTKRTVQQVYQEALHSLSLSAVPDSMPCRKAERQALFEFLYTGIRGQLGGVMYVSGMPGTGKTATVHEVLRELRTLQEQAKLPAFQFLEVNGMKLNTAADLYSALHRAIFNERVLPSKAIGAVEREFKQNGDTDKVCRVILLDELDELCAKSNAGKHTGASSQRVLYNVLEWPQHPNSRLLILGIANTMDLMERSLPRLMSRSGIERINFLPYTHQDIQEIVRCRIEGTRVFEPSGVELCARKVASSSGDLRKALEVCSRAIELAEEDASRTRSLDVEWCNAFLISIDVVEKAIRLVFWNPQVGIIQNLSKFEKVFLLSLFLVQQKHQIMGGGVSTRLRHAVDRCRGLCLEHRLGEFLGEEMWRSIAMRLVQMHLVEVQSEARGSMILPDTLIGTGVEKDTLRSALRGEDMGRALN